MLSTSYKIMHYFLGFPPYRTGGLTKFAVDLMECQSEYSKVIGMWPGKMKLFDKGTRIEFKKKYNEIYSAELINPLPVPLDEGISEPRLFMSKGDIDEYKRVLERVRPQIIHLHTLMGLHEEFLLAAKELKIPIVYTTHDYFGICTKVYLFADGRPCDVSKSCDECTACNRSGLSYKKIMIMQSPIYKMCKNNPIVKLIRKKHRENYFDDNKKDDNDISVSEEIVQRYGELRTFYKRMLMHVDYFHFTSSVAEKIYKDFVPEIKGEVINITHRDIGDNRRIRTVDNSNIRFTYLAPAKPYKGFNILRQAMDELYDGGKTNFSLNLYSPVSNPSGYMNVKEDGYSYSDLEAVFDNTDVLIAPSVWYETFGYTVLEAISYGIPVVISDRVGAKDIVNDCGIQVDVTSKEKLKKLLESLDAERIMKLNRNIIENFKIKEWSEFTDEINALYEKTLREASVCNM